MSAQDLTEDEEAEAVDEDIVEDVTAEDEDDEAEVEDDENTELVSRLDFDQTYTECMYNTVIAQFIEVLLRHDVTIERN